MGCHLFGAGAGVGGNWLGLSSVILLFVEICLSIFPFDV